MIVPVSSLPAARRTSGASRPWSIELRTRCTSGSAIFSIRPLSSSVPSPTVRRRTCLPRRAERSRTSRGKRRNTASTGSMRTPITASCRSRVLRSSSSRPAVRRSDSDGSNPPLTCLRMAWVMTSSPTRLISASTLSTLTRIEDSASAVAAGVAGGAPVPDAAGVAATTGAVATAAAAAAACGRMSSSQSSTTQANTSSMALRGTLPRRPRSQAMHASSGSSWVNPGRRSNLASTCSGPRCSSSRRMRSGSLPLMNSEGAGVKAMSQPSGSGVAAAVACAVPVPAPSSRSSRSCMAATVAGSAGLPCSASASRARSTSTEPSIASTALAASARLPPRTSSSRVSRTWVRPAILPKPNVAAPPLIECAARNTEFTTSGSTLPPSSASRPDSMASRPSRLSSK